MSEEWSGGLDDRQYSLNRRVALEVGDCRHRFVELVFGGDFGGDVGGVQRTRYGPGDPTAEIGIPIPVAPKIAVTAPMLAADIG